MSLVERMRDDVQQGNREECQAALQDHEAHLRHCRPGERGLDRRLGQHHHTAEDRGEAADHDQSRKDDGSLQHDIGEADQQEAAGIDDARMEKCRNRCWRLHDFRQPSMGGELCGLQQGSDSQKCCSGDRQRQALSLLCFEKDGGDVTGLEGDSKQATAPIRARSPSRETKNFLRAARLAAIRSG